MTQETKAKIEQEADRFKMLPHYNDGSPLSVSPQLYLKKGYIAGATAYAKRCEELEQEVAALKQWKAESIMLLDPILEYGRNHPDIKLGTSITEFVLNRAKFADTKTNNNG